MVDVSDSTDTSAHDVDADRTVHQTADESIDEPASSASPLDANTVVTYLQWGALLAFAILAVVAGAGLYSSLGSIIDVWVAHEYRPFARTGLNLAVLAAAVAGIVAIIRRL